MNAQHTFVKICGITRLRDARVATRAGADAIGFVFARSPRRISPAAARKIILRIHPSIRKFGVFVDSPIERIVDIISRTGIDGIQLQGGESQEFIDELKSREPSMFVAKVVRIRDRDGLQAGSFIKTDAIFLDTKDPSRLSGSRSIPTSWLSDVEHPFVLAGGLEPSSVRKTIRSVRPWGVDVSSGVETDPGKKDPDLVRSFIKAVREGEVMTRHPSVV